MDSVFHIHHNKTGNSDEWKDGDGIVVGLKLSPISSKYRYIKFNGYDRQGRGKNQNKLQARATNIEDKIKLMCGIKCYVNQYCFEVKSDEIGHDILCTIWV